VDGYQKKRYLCKEALGLRATAKTRPQAPAPRHGLCHRALLATPPTPRFLNNVQVTSHSIRCSFGDNLIRPNLLSPCGSKREAKDVSV
jgi:hypothetical protein